MNIYALQFDIAWEDKAANHRTVEQLLQSSAPVPGSIVVLPEMFATGFSMNLTATDDTASGQTLRFVRSMALQYGVTVVAGLVNRHHSGLGLNQSIAISPSGEELARYDKIFPFTPGGEAAHYAAGSRLSLFPWQGFTVAQFICYDLRFPEIFRAAASQGANLITVIASWPKARTAHWIALLQARAIENQSYVVGVNRCGQDPGFGYSGRSLVIAPSGEIIADAGNASTVISATPDIEDLVDYRRRLPFLADLRPAYCPAPPGPVV